MSPIQQRQGTERIDTALKDGVERRDMPLIITAVDWLSVFMSTMTHAAEIEPVTTG